MAGTTSSKFYWSDWRSDPCLRTCSLAARGLWMDMLCIAAEAQPTGYVLVHGRTLTMTDLARLTGAPEADVQSALAELDAAGVFSRDRKGRIYSRRMVRDKKTSQKNRKNGLEGGNPTLWAQSKKSRPLKPPDKPPPYAPIPIAFSKKEDSEEPYGSPDAASASADPTKEIFDRGVAILGGKRRSLLGKLCKSHGEPAVLEAILACETEQPIEPAAFLIGCLARAGPKASSSHRPSPVENLYLGAMRAADKFDELDRQSADRRTDNPVVRPLLDRR